MGRMDGIGLFGEQKQYRVESNKSNQTPISRYTDEHGPSKLNDPLLVCHWRKVDRRALVFVGVLPLKNN